MTCGILMKNVFHCTFVCKFRCVISLTAVLTHSASMSQLKYIFEFLLGNLKGKTLLDIGSRTGAILYGVRYLIKIENISIRDIFLFQYFSVCVSVFVSFMDMLLDLFHVS